MKIFDTHCHYDDTVFDEDRESLLSGLHSKGVDRIVNVGAAMSGCYASYEMAKQHEFVYAALGIHPSEVAELTEADMAWIQEHASFEKVVAIGEIGLDYHWPDPEPEIQKKWFVRQIKLAKETGLPVIIHSREAAADTMEIIKREQAYENGGVIHCFSYSPEVAKEYVEMGFYIGIGGVVTFKNAKKCVRTVEQIPLEKIVLETDCPYMSPEPHRGERNESSKLAFVAAKIAEIKGTTADEVIRITTENANRMYGIV